MSDEEDYCQIKELDLSTKKLNELPDLSKYTNLKELDCSRNEITSLPLELCHLRNLREFMKYNNPIEHIPLPVQRWLDRLNNIITRNNLVYADGQNIHNHHIQNSFRVSLQNIMNDKDPLKLEQVIQEITENPILGEQTKREIINYCDEKSVHTTYLITYSDLLQYVWTRIMKHSNRDDILGILNQEISDGVCMCFTGRLTRLLNTLVGFYPDVQIQISDSEQITNIITTLNKRFEGDELKEAVKKELEERNYSPEVIEEWLGYI